MSPEPGGQGLLERGELGPEPAPGQLGQDFRIGLPLDRARIMARRETPITSAATTATLTPASSRTLCTRFTSRLRSSVRALR